MAVKLAEGSMVRLADREPTAADLKLQIFFPHYRGLTGTIAKLYADGTATITIDPESLPEDLRKRHQAGTEAMRQKWLDGLSDEARNKLSASEKKFSLRYNLLVAVADLSPTNAAAPPPAAPARERSDKTAQPSLELDGVAAAAEPPRKSLAEMEAEEARHLEEVTRKRKGS